MKRKIIAATRNKGKLRELRDILSEFEIMSQDEIGIDTEIEENGETFLENAVKKATGIMRICGLPCIADDSGLEVHALDGRPGVHSARYAGQGADDAARVEKLLGELNGVEDRRARFVSVVAFADIDGTLIAVRGECGGLIAHTPAGEGGFGYDPVFISDDYGSSFAQISDNEKNAVSHRAQALKKLEKIIRAI